MTLFSVIITLEIVFYILLKQPPRGSLTGIDLRLFVFKQRAYATELQCITGILIIRDSSSACKMYVWQIVQKFYFD